MIKLDIVNAVVTKTSVTRTKAEEAVETVFNTLKNALGRGQRIELRRFGVFSVKPRKTGMSAAIRGPRRRSVSLLEKPCASNPAKSFSRSEASAFADHALLKFLPLPGMHLKSHPDR